MGRGWRSEGSAAGDDRQPTKTLGASERQAAKCGNSRSWHMCDISIPVNGSSRRQRAYRLLCVAQSGDGAVQTHSPLLLCSRTHWSWWASMSWISRPAKAVGENACHYWLDYSEPANPQQIGRGSFHLIQLRRPKEELLAQGEYGKGEVVSTPRYANSLPNRLLPPRNPTLSCSSQSRARIDAKHANPTRLQADETDSICIAKARPAVAALSHEASVGYCTATMERLYPSSRTLVVRIFVTM